MSATDGQRYEVWSMPQNHVLLYHHLVPVPSGDEDTSGCHPDNLSCLPPMGDLHLNIPRVQP